MVFPVRWLSYLCQQKLLLHLIGNPPWWQARLCLRWWNSQILGLLCCLDPTIHAVCWFFQHHAEASSAYHTWFTSFMLFFSFLIRGMVARAYIGMASGSPWLVPSWERSTSNLDPPSFCVEVCTRANVHTQYLTNAILLPSVLFFADGQNFPNQTKGILMPASHTYWLPGHHWCIQYHLYHTAWQLKRSRHGIQIPCTPWWYLWSYLSHMVQLVAKQQCSLLH